VLTQSMKFSGLIGPRRAVKVRYYLLGQTRLFTCEKDFLI
jgi:hypothetical protein